MAEKGKGGDKAGEKSAKPAAKKSKKGISSYYTISGSTITRKKACPKCGRGFFMAEHKDRVTCGNCHYTEFRKKEPK